MADQQRYRRLCAAADARLEEILKAGSAPQPQSLAGFEWRGCNTRLFTAALGIRKFIKGFFFSHGKLEGYNIPVRQNGLSQPWLHKPNAQAPARFGFYEVTPAQGRYPNALLLDYGASARNPVWRPERLLRDYIVQDPESPDIVIGKAYLALGTLVPVGFFVLERLRPSAWSPNA